MISIFTSPKKLVLHTPANRQSVLSALESRLIPEPSALDIFGWASLSAGTFVAKADSGDILVSYVTGVRNSLRPTMHIHVESATAGGTVVLTRFSTSFCVKVFLIVWMTGASIPAAMALPGGALTSLVFFPFFGAWLIILMRLLARVDEDELERMVRNAIKDAECREGITATNASR